MMKKLLTLLLAVCFTASCIVGCQVPGQTAQQPPVAPLAPSSAGSEASQTPGTGTNQSLLVAHAREISIMDPHVTNNSDAATCLKMVYEGLLNMVDGKPAPGMAESYDVSEDGTVYTFHLRDASWSDGKPVTAQDFYETYVRMLTREDAMNLAYLIYPIKNALALSEGTVDVSEFGVKAIDEKTLEITLAGPYPYMLDMFCTSAMLPVRIDLVNEHGGEYGSSPETIVSNGAYILKEWVHGDKQIYVKNPDYWNESAVKIPEVTILTVTDANTRKNMYDLGEIDWLEIVKAAEINEYKDTPEYGTVPVSSVRWLTLAGSPEKASSPEHGAITMNRNFINALSSSIDRTGLVAAMFPTGFPQTAIINPGVSDQMGNKWGDNYAVGDTYHSATQNLDKAKEYMAKACEELGYASAADMPVMDFLCFSTEEDRTYCEYFQNVWLTTFGLRTELRQLENTQYWENFYGSTYDIARSGWGPDYDDALTFLEIWDYRGDWNKTGWKSDAYAALLDEANAINDPKKRLDLFAQAEKILLSEAPVIPVYYLQTAYILRTDKVKNVSVNSFMPYFDFRYATYE